MNDGRAPEPHGAIRFYQWCRPPLQSGDYKLSVGQPVKELSQNFTNELSFTIDAPRFGLKPDDVYSVYPPKGQAGDFGNTLPHIVFSRRTLPWEATMDAALRGPDDPAPWFALIVLGAGDCPDGFPKLESRKIEQAVGRDGSVAGAQIAVPDAAEGAEDAKPRLRSHEVGRSCNTIDLETALFRRIAPEPADLPFLSHVREVLTHDKETASFLTDGWFSVAVANRLPQAPKQRALESSEENGIENRAYLISLIGMKKHLEGGLTAEKVRLIVLAHWSFRCNRGLNFTQRMHNIAPGRLAVLPSASAAAPHEGKADAKTLVAEALGIGYVPLPHAMRLGDSSVSWYRGPLTPVAVAKEPRYAFRESPDDALRYSAVSGMFDASYASAYQLGRLLAMHDRHFAETMRGFRRSVRSEINAAREARLTAETLGMENPRRGERIAREFLMALGPDWTQTLVTLRPPREETYTRSSFEGIRLLIPSAIRQWLARLSLLYRVPFSYLVPNGRLLPPDSLRFFHLDPTWIKCLLEGACSIGRNSRGDSQIDRRLRQYFLDFALRESRAVRRRPAAPGEEDENPDQQGRNRKAEVILTDDEATAEDPDLADWAVSGFLMRSPVVEGWQGLEIRAWDKKGTKLNPLRIDRMSPEVLLCLFDGDLDRIEIAMPPEGLHFGVDRSGMPETGDATTLIPYKYSVRNQKDGSAVSLKDPLMIPLRSPSSDRRLDLAKLAIDLPALLKENGLREGDAPLTSAEIALQLLDASACLKLSRESNVAE